MSKIGNSARKAKIWTIAILLILVLLFVIQNRQPQKISFLFWHPRVSLSLALILVAGMGFLAGLLSGARKAQPKG